MSAEPAALPHTGPPQAESGLHPEYGLWHYVWKLLRLRAVITLSTFRRAKPGRKIAMAFLALLVAAFAVFVFAMSWLLLGFLRSPVLAQALAVQNLGEASVFLESIPTLILTGALLGILLTSFGVLLQALYLAGDMDFLLSIPVPIRAVFVAKLLQAILPNFSLIALFSLPVLFGLGAAKGYNVLYYPLVVVVLAVLALATAGLSSLLVMGVVRVFPARRVAEVLGFLGALISIICSQTGNLMNTTHLARGRLTAQQLPLAWAPRLNAAWSPIAWAGRGLVDFGEGRWLTGIGFLVLTLSIASVLFVISLTTAERLYYTGWANLQITLRKKTPRRPLPTAASQTRSSPAFIGRVIPPVIRAIVWKDFLVLRRDLRNMSQMIMPIVLGVIYGTMLLRSGGNLPAGQGEAPAWFMQTLKSVIIYANVGISLFVGWSLLSRLALMGFSQEGRSYWMLKSAPVGFGQLLFAKFLVAYLPSVALGWAFMLAISLIQRSGLAILLFGLAVVALSIAGATGVSLVFGVMGANLAWEDPRRMSAGLSGCLSMPVSFAYLAACLGLFFIPPVILPRLGVPEVAGQVIGLVLGGALSIACAVIAPRLVVHRVARIGEG